MTPTQGNELSIADFASKFINNTNKHIFLTGKAGSGKTTFLKSVIKSTYKNAAIVAPTGIAAINAGGVTIHSFFQIPPSAFVPQKENDNNPQLRISSFKELLEKHRMVGNRRSVLQNLELLIVDEVSMLRADLLDAIDHILKSVRRKPFEAFGGVQVLFIGDLLQLPPVVKDDEWSFLKRYYSSIYFFDALVFKENSSKPIYLELDKIYRQHDQEFISLLNNFRTNNISEADIKLLNNHYKPDFKSTKNNKYIYLSTHNYQADKINQESLNELKEKSFFFDAEVKDDFADYLFPVEPRMELKKGAQVMFVKNDPDFPKRYFNGKIATISNIEKDSIEVMFEESNEPMQLDKFTWENITYKHNDTTNEIEENVVGTFTQYPIKLAWAITVHKSQGLTFEKAILDLGNAFAPGQVYVALSRLTSLKGLVLTSKINYTRLANDEKVLSYADNKINKQALVEILENEQFVYIQNYLLECFDFKELNIQFQRHLETYSDTGKKSVKNLNFDFAVSLKDKISSLKETSDKFLSWIYNNFLNRIELADKLSAKVIGAKNFFEPKFKELSDLLQKKIAELDNEKRTKEYLEELYKLDTLCFRKIQKIQKSKILVESAFSPIEIKVNLEEIKIVNAERTNQLKDTNYSEPETNAKNFKYSKSSKEKPPKKEKIDTKKVSYELYLKKKSIEEIAAERNLAVGTISNHLSHYVGLGLIPLNKFVKKDISNKIIKLLKSDSNILSKEIIEKFGGKIGYTEVNFVRAYFDNCNKEVV
ncbi:MAG: helix-turn-helix domain-containing protein [Bacteroidota bacterium]